MESNQSMAGRLKIDFHTGSGVSVAMGDALQPGDLLVTIKSRRPTTEEAEPGALAA